MYKQCPNCGHEWPTREALLSDPDIELVGYQVNFSQLEAGMLLFNHICKGTLALKAVDFKDLHDGPVFTHRATDSEQCPGQCMHEGDLLPCPAECECAYVRNILDRINHWPKHP